MAMRAMVDFFRAFFLLCEHIQYCPTRSDLLVDNEGAASSDNDRRAIAVTVEAVQTQENEQQQSWQRHHQQEGWMQLCAAQKKQNTKPNEAGDGVVVTRILGSMGS